MNISNNRGYKLLPFKFTRINSKELIVNEVGDYLFVPYGTVRRILERNILRTEELYKDLLANYIICEDYCLFLISVDGFLFH